MNLLLRHLSIEHPICTAIYQRIGDFPAELIRKIEAGVALTENDLCHPILPQYVSLLEEFCQRLKSDAAKKSLRILNSVFPQTCVINNQSQFQLIL